MQARKLSPAFLAAMILFVAPATVALTTYPPYYEDESWIYLAPFEALRGNGFSWAAFHEGTSSAGLFNALAFLFVRISPFAAEATVRLTSLLFALAAIAGVFAAARKIAGANAAIASTLLMLAPMWFLPVRYGRIDALAIAFAMWAVAAAASESYFVAGVLSGLSMGVHPVFVWIGPLCALIVLQRGGLRSVWRYALGGLAGAAPELAWMAIHFHDFQSIAARYFVTSSVGKGWTASVANEWTRYRAYAQLLTGFDIVAQAFGFVVLPVVAMVVAPRRERLVLGAIALIPLAALAMLVGGKNPLYFIYALPFLAVVAAANARRLPFRWMEAACVAALIAAAVRYAPAMREAAKAPSVTQEVEQIASRLPANAVVFSPLIYGGLIQRRPDLTFFTYHALSTRTGWALPPCAEIPDTIRSLIEQDPRPSSRLRKPDVVYFVSFPDPVWYLRLIYLQATLSDVTCIFGNSTPQVVRVCNGANCMDSLLVERRLR